MLRTIDRNPRQDVPRIRNKELPTSQTCIGSPRYISQSGLWCDTLDTHPPIQTRNLSLLFINTPLALWFGLAIMYLGCDVDSNKLDFDNVQWSYSMNERLMEASRFDGSIGSRNPSIYKPSMWIVLIQIIFIEYVNIEIFVGLILFLLSSNFCVIMLYLPIRSAFNGSWELKHIYFFIIDCHEQKIKIVPSKYDYFF